MNEVIAIIGRDALGSGRRKRAEAAGPRGPFCSVQDARYVIQTITFFSVSCPENSAFFRKKSAIFLENSKENIAHFEFLEKCCILEKSRKFG